MRFDYTNGRPAKYLVSIYCFNCHDLLLYPDYRTAKAAFKKLKEEPHDKGTVLSLYDYQKDVRKEMVRC
jgi:hypothetical protein